MRAVVLGATGYAGQVLLSLLAEHSQIDEVIAVSSSRAGEAIAPALPRLPGAAAEGRFASLEEAAAQKADVVFSCLPHLKSAPLLEPFFGRAVVIDLSADFRIPDPTRFNAGYGQAPPREDLLPQAVYGLSEAFREQIRTADIIANPGCYPTSILLPLLPLVERGMIGGRIVANAMSGVTGAGKKVQEAYLFAEVDESLRAYAPGKTHRHWYEMAHYLDAADIDLFFMPHLVPMRRGIAATIVGSRKDCAGDADLVTAYREAYRDAPFVRLRQDAIPATGDVRGSNRCDIAWRVEEDTIMLFSGIDNLMKGAAGQALQNMNIRFGLPEEEGLSGGAVI